MKKTTLIALLSLGFFSSYSQDNCISALEITAGTYTVAAINGNEVPPALCLENGASSGEWYVYTPTENHSVIVTTDLEVNVCGDTRIQIYTGNCGSLSCLVGDDDAGNITCTSNGFNYLSTVAFNVTANTKYFITFDNKWNSGGFDFELNEYPFLAPPVTFIPQSITGSGGVSCVVDMNNDHLDDIVTAQPGQMTILKQLPEGGFLSTSYPLAGFNAVPDWSIAAGDYDKNGYNDLVFGNNSRVTVVKANATGSAYSYITYPQSIFTQRTNFIDINNDGNLDLFACHDVAQSHAYRNDGAGNLVFDISLFPTLAVGGNYQSQWSDLDNDGDMDMYLAKCRGGAPAGDPQRINLFYKNNGDGTFTESGAAAGINDGAQSWSTAIEDYDNDGDMDIMLSNISDSNKLFKNNGDGTFTDVYATSGIGPEVGSWELQAADFNNDGWIDFIWQNGKELYINNGNMTFTGFDLAFNDGGIGDLNNDGFLDVQNGTTVYYNQPNGNHWLQVNLQGIESNENGIGARIEIYGEWGEQIREIKSGNGFSHQSSLNGHFGIGTSESIDKLVIKWPSGNIDVIYNPQTDQAITVSEGSFPLGVGNTSTVDLIVYPNPVKDLINIQPGNKLNNIKTAEIFDLAGKLISKKEITNHSISVQGLSTGTYILVLKDDQGKKYSQKFVKS